MDTFLEISKTHWEIDEIPLENKNLHIMLFGSISEHIKYIWKQIFRIGRFFYWKLILIKNLC